jgi:hypothetical protein
MPAEDMEGIGMSKSSTQLLLDDIWPGKLSPRVSISLACIVP